MSMYVTLLITYPETEIFEFFGCGVLHSSGEWGWLWYIYISSLL